MSSQVCTKNFSLNPSISKPPTRDHTNFPDSLPPAKETKLHPTGAGDENASLFFVGTATTILEWAGIRLMTDPNFLHAGDHVHLGPGVTSTRRTNPAVDLCDLPRIDMVLLSHYHADHFDEKVEESLRRDLPIVTTPHARKCLVDEKEEGEKFNAVTDLDFWESCVIKIEGGDLTEEKRAAIKVTGMPGKHVPPGPLNVINELLHAVPPTNGWMVELGYTEHGQGDGSFTNGYRIYISGDTLLIDELKEIPERYKGQNIDLMLIHLGGTTIPSPSVPLLMVTMDAEQGIKLLQLIEPDITIPIHYEQVGLVLKEPPF
ncbi:hypothetical protein BLS_009999 [Venturia inaequalis]|uniref:Metallo-beta-lactamase domain-containing protein n=1 Tax=Venturia inaequalis TaxID=5025 RepID=A0A8H3UQW2_VENIN|nr:hypothetical protein BLS_009999 [Venturia inaequalis]KAE9974660.1 hypothetical protein EG328_003727 [Venturia inaequalis]KAE9986945.1 hypothetical protein EG327_004055 [Venturia inaequalis]RDI87133.1 hypothetical protein Vi05172_g2690 [Venturia inaequalis]